jgi:hypothetical protein
MYSSVRERVNVARAALLLALWPTVVRPAEPPALGFADMRCDAGLTAMFTPPHPQLGRYEVCTSPAALPSLAPVEWRRETLAPLDAFGSAGAYDRARLSRLYGGRSVAVARGWIRQGERFESITLISPHPDAALAHLQPGTLVIRFIICCS